MKQATNSLIKVQVTQAVELIFEQLKLVLVGKDFEPWPAYWALIPLKPVNTISTRQK